MTDTHIVDRMFASLTAGDLPAVLACFTPEALIWHSFDRLAQSPAEASVAWEGMIKAFPVLKIGDVSRQETASGCVQQHLWFGETEGGKRIAWPICVVVRIENGLIARLDEYLDRAGSFDPGEAALRTPGM